MVKGIIRLSEGELCELIKGCVERILCESDEYSLPYGGFDLFKRDYDKALRDAKSLEDWDARMAKRKEFADIKARCAMYAHPQSINFPQLDVPSGSLGASMYANPKEYPNVEDFERYYNDDKRLNGF